MSFPATRNPAGLPLPFLADELLKRTTSRCPVCHVPCPGEVWRRGSIPAKVFLKRTCPEHGEASVCIASDARFYWLAQGKSENSCCGTQACRASDASPAGTLGRNATPGDAIGIMEKLSTCLALIEIVHSCNLACPTCYADSPQGTGAKVNAVPLDDLKGRIQGVIDRKGGIEILQLSGGEPTLHPQFFELLRWLQDHPKIDYVLLNTNGVRIAHDDSFAIQLGEAFRYGSFQLYLQFDGVQEEGQKFLRGADLRITRERCLERCRAFNIPVTLAMTVTHENISFLWEAIEFGLTWPNVRGISFQPMFGSGRVPARAAAERNTEQVTAEDCVSTRINTADVILAAVHQSAGQLRFDDFTPLPCGDPNCATIGYLLKVDGKVRSVSDFIDFTAVQGFLADKVRYRLEDLMKCGCDSEPLGELLRQFELNETHTFRLFIKPFMDARTWDEDRIDRCCTHVIRPDGKLDSFCRVLLGLWILIQTTSSPSTAYGWLMLAGILVSLVFWSRRARHDQRLLFIYVAALAGAFFGAKVVYLLAEGWLRWDDPNRWAHLASGKSILGALLGGYAAVEIAKRQLGYKETTGDLFAVLAPLGLLFGRVGCILHGCCLGRAQSASWFTMPDRAGVERWPAAHVEWIFNALALGIILGLKSRGVLRGQLFHVYLMAYGLFRFAHEYFRATPQIAGPFSGYQIAALGVLVFGAFCFVQRRKKQRAAMLGVNVP